MASGSVSIGAVIVSFEGGNVLRTTVEHLLGQVDTIVIVDNGSMEDASRNVLELIEHDPALVGTTVLRNRTNLGIAAALNRGISWLVTRGCAWILTMDQDSSASPGMVARLHEACEMNPRVAIAAPLSLPYDCVPMNRTSPVAEMRDLDFIHTSGNLVRADAWKTLGGFREDYFIDCVDYEFCWRIRRAGYRILQVPAAQLRHRFARLSVVHVLGRRITCTNYPAQRRYYQVRNGIALARTMSDRKYSWAMVGSVVRETVKVVLFEKQKYRKLASTARGIRDGMLGRLGRVEI